MLGQIFILKILVTSCIFSFDLSVRLRQLLTDRTGMNTKRAGVDLNFLEFMCEKEGVWGAMSGAGG